MALKRVLTARDLVLFNIVALLGLRGMSTAAKMGPVAVPLWGLAILAFLLPHALSVAELATRDPGEGGVYRWSRAAFGDAHGFLAGWFYWISNITYLPTLLTTAIGFGVYVIARPGLGENGWFVCGASVVLLWLAAWANVRGLQLGRWISNAGGASIWIGAMVLIVVAVACFRRFGSVTPWHAATLFGGIGTVRSLGYFGTLAFALCGLELGAGMGDETQDPMRTMPKSILLASPVVALTYIAGTAAILVILQVSQVSPISGAVGALQAGADRLGWTGVAPVAAALVALATYAGVYAWMGGVARVPFAAGLDQFIPPAFGRLHPRYGTPYVAIYVQCAVVTVFILGSQFGSSVREAFLVVLDMTIILNFVPYLYLFLAVPRLRRTHQRAGVTAIPGGTVGLWLVTLAGAGTTLLTMISSMVPTPDVTSPVMFELKVWGGLIAFGASGYALYRWRMAGSAS